MKNAEVTIPTLITFFDIYINNNAKKDKDENIKEFIKKIYKLTNGIIEDRYSEIENNKIRIELDCKTLNIDIPMKCKQKELRNKLFIKSKQLLDEMSKEIGVKIEVKEVDVSEYPQYYLNEEQMHRYNEYFSNYEEIIEEI
ncbi:MAG: hypothetical protein Q4G09_07040 [Clostridia bacterium]|nr:hypothetical protein [Clostridia bacterium]